MQDSELLERVRTSKKTLGRRRRKCLMMKGMFPRFHWNMVETRDQVGPPLEPDYENINLAYMLSMHYKITWRCIDLDRKPDSWKEMHCPGDRVADHEIGWKKTSPIILGHRKGSMMPFRVHDRKHNSSTVHNLYGIQRMEKGVYTLGCALHFLHCAQSEVYGILRLQREMKGDPTKFIPPCNADTRTIMPSAYLPQGA